MKNPFTFKAIDPFACIYKPKEDITAFELAKLLPYLLSSQHFGLTREIYDAMGSEKRHLEPIGPNPPPAVEKFEEVIPHGPDHGIYNIMEINNLTGETRWVADFDPLPCPSSAWTRPPQRKRN